MRQRPWDDARAALSLGPAHLFVGQADDPLAAIQVLAAVTCVCEARVSTAALVLMYAPPRPAPPGAALTEDAGELGRTAHEALEVHPEPAVPVAASEGLGQLVVEVEACEEPALFIVFTGFHVCCRFSF